jgi:hypothetical protein
MRKPQAKRDLAFFVTPSQRDIVLALAAGKQERGHWLTYDGLVRRGVLAAGACGPMLTEHGQHVANVLQEHAAIQQSLPASKRVDRIALKRKARRKKAAPK